MTTSEFRAALRKARLTVIHAAELWPIHTDSVSALAADAMLARDDWDTLSMWACAAWEFKRAGDRDSSDDITLIAAVLLACMDCDAEFTSPLGRVCWRDSWFPVMMRLARRMAGRLESVKIPRRGPGTRCS